jgi:molybdenum cofactor synthesis domain-containing protein
MYTTGIITLSDLGSQGLREDKSGPLIKEMLESMAIFEISKTIILPDDVNLIKKALIDWADSDQINLILTTGGTGFSQRDWTPEATIAVCDRLAPGIPEAMRYYSLQITPKAMLSRSAAGIRKNTLIINLPGSPKAVKENLEAILPSLEHGLQMLLSLGSSNCAEPIKK